MQFSNLNIFSINTCNHFLIYNRKFFSFLLLILYALICAILYLFL